MRGEVEELEALLRREDCSRDFLEGMERLLLGLEFQSDPGLSPLLLRLRELVSRLRSSYSLLSSRTPLREEWRRVVNYEFLRLKEEAHALREELRRRGCGGIPDLRRLAEEMRREGAIGEASWALLLSAWDPREAEREEVRRALLRVLALFSEFRRRRGGGWG